MFILGGFQVFPFLFHCEMPYLNSGPVILAYPFLSKNFTTLLGAI